MLAFQILLIVLLTSLVTAIIVLALVFSYLDKHFKL